MYLGVTSTGCWILVFFSKIKLPAHKLERMSSKSYRLVALATVSFVVALVMLILYLTGGEIPVPTEQPTSSPTPPTLKPTSAPSLKPTSVPTLKPTAAPA